MLWLAKNPAYEHFPVSMKEFLTNPMFTPPEDNRRPHSQIVLTEIFDTWDTEEEFHNMGKFEEILYIAGIGSGKSFLSSKAMQYVLYRLLCLKNPQTYFNLGIGARIAFVNISKSFSQAKDVVFGEIGNRISNSPWFQKYYPPDPNIKSVMRFPKNIYVLPLGSNEEAAIGYNVFGAVIDEAAFHLLTKDKDYALEAYNQIKKRIRSRFLKRGKMFIITSPRYIYDFAETKYREDDNPLLYKRRTPLWEAIPESAYSGEKFDLAKYFPNYEGKGVLVPEEYEPEFKQNPEKALRDYGAQPSLSIQGFFRDPDMIKLRVNQERSNPIDPRTNGFHEWFYNKSGTPSYDSEKRFIHVDLALNRDSDGDAAGFCMGKFNGWKVVNLPDGRIEKRPMIYIDYYEQIKSGHKKEILFSDIRDKIYKMKEIGYNIDMVTFDGWNSIDSIQTLRSAGYKADVLSVDRSLEPYYTLKEALLDGRLDYYDYEPVITELMGLEEVNGRKVDHPRLGSKDVSDAMAAVCYHAAKRTPGSGVLGSS